MKVDTLPNGRQLTYGAYKDCSRPLRRCLKQLGSGSIEGGIAAIKADSKALQEVSAILGVDNQVSLSVLLGVWLMLSCLLEWINEQGSSLHQQHAIRACAKRERSMPVKAGSWKGSRDQWLFDPTKELQAQVTQVKKQGQQVSGSCATRKGECSVDRCC